MLVRSYITEVFYQEYEDIKNKTIYDLIKILYENKTNIIYIVKNKIPFYIITATDIYKLVIDNNLEYMVDKYIKDNPKELVFTNEDENIIDTYYYMRKYKYKHLPVVDENNHLIGEVSFRLISLKIADLVIKDPLTGVYNKKYFDVLVEEYKEMEKPLGIIYIELKNMNIIESFYNIDTVNNIIKLTAEIIKKALRDIDFVFRIDYQFRIFTFTDLETTDKIVKRIKGRLNTFEYNGIKPSFEIVFSHVPELENNILSAIDYCEKKLIERD